MTTRHGRTSTDGTADGLQNGVDYRVGVAAVDQVGNVGVLSGVDCQTPQDITDFFEYYRMKGGQAGGGFCAVSRFGEGVTWPFAGFGALVTIGMLRRLRRRA